jgi:hypothetical protein
VRIWSTLNLLPTAIPGSPNARSCRDVIGSVELRDQLNLADDFGVQCAEVFGGNPVVQDGLAAHLADLIAVQGALFILIRSAWPECHKMITARRVAAETDTPGK